MPCVKVLYCVIRQAYGMSCVEVASTVSVGDPPSALSRSKHGPPVGVSLLAIGCEAVVKKAGYTTAGKPFRLYREQGGAPPRSIQKNHFHSDSYFLFDESCRRLRMAACHGYCLCSLRQLLKISAYREYPQSIPGFTSSGRKPTSALQLSRLRQTPTIWRTARPGGRCFAVPKAASRHARQGWCRS